MSTKEQERLLLSAVFDGDVKAARELERHFRRANEHGVADRLAAMRIAEAEQIAETLPDFPESMQAWVDVALQSVQGQPVDVELLLRRMVQAAPVAPLGATEFLTNHIVLPDPNTGLALDSVVNALGFMLPPYLGWASWCHGQSITRVKYHFKVTVTTPAEVDALSETELLEGLYDAVTPRILSFPPQDAFHVEHELQSREWLGGTAHLLLERPFHPFLLSELLSFDFFGIAPGVLGRDAYGLQASVVLYFSEPGHGPWAEEGAS